MKTINELEQEAQQARDEMREVMLDEFGIRATLSDRILSLMIRAVQSNIVQAEQLRNGKLIRVDEAKTHTFTVPIDTTRRDYVYSNGEIRVVPLDSIKESLPEVSQEERDSDGWIKWDGGDCPVDPNVDVFVEFRNDSVTDTAYKAGSYEWRRDIVERSWDIVAYKIVKGE